MSGKEISRVAVIGAGLMGHGIAQVFAANNYAVCLQDIKQKFLSKAVDDIRANLKKMSENGLVSPENIDKTVSRITTTTSMKEAAGKAEFIVEAVNENLALKQNIFEQLDQLCSEDTILATNTSVMSITEIASKCVRRGRIVGTHFWNPPYLIPLVEVVKANDTTNETVDATYRLLVSAGKHPIKVMKDVPGFVANRLQHALWREAISIVQNGIADAATVDEAVKNSFGMRLAVLGPMENADLVGLDLTLAIHEYILKYLEASPAPAPLLREKVARGELGFKSGCGFQVWSTCDIEMTIFLRSLQYLIEFTKRNHSKK